MPLDSHDLALALRALERADPAPNATVALGLTGFALTLVRVAPGQRFEHLAEVPTMLLVLDGIGTVAVDDWRATLAGGHVVAIAERARAVATADNGAALSLLFTAAEAPTPQ